MSAMSEYVQALRAMKKANGSPSNRELGRRTGLNSVYVGQILSGGLRGSWETVRTLVLAMDGDPDEIEPLYRGLPCRGGEDAGPPTQSDVASIAAFLTIAQAFSEATWTLEGEAPDCCMPDGGGHGGQVVEVREYGTHPWSD